MVESRSHGFPPGRIKRHFVLARQLRQRQLPARQRRRRRARRSCGGGDGVVLEEEEQEEQEAEDDDDVPVTADDAGDEDQVDDLA